MLIVFVCLSSLEIFLTIINDIFAFNFQVAIVCKTPKFKDLKIDKPVNVEFLLRRPSDMEQSDPVGFIYVPFDEGKKWIQFYFIHLHICAVISDYTHVMYS